MKTLTNRAVPAMRRRGAGFTLMELIFAIAIVGVLTTLAYPNFTQSVRKSRRVEALDALMQLQLAQERYRLNNPSYATLAQLGIAATTPEGNYTLAVVNPLAGTYTATATAVAGTSQVDDRVGSVSCAVLTVNQDEAVYAPAGQSACWSR